MKKRVRPKLQGVSAVIANMPVDNGKAIPEAPPTFHPTVTQKPTKTYPNHRQPQVTPLLMIPTLNFRLHVKLTDFFIALALAAGLIMIGVVIGVNLR